MTVNFALNNLPHNVYMKSFMLMTFVLFIVLLAADGVINEGRYRQTTWLNAKYESHKVADGMSNAAKSLFR